MFDTHFTFFEDPGHGWLEVPKNILKKLGIARQISEYSYEKGDYAYLEEDCDAPLFIQAIQAAGIGFTVKEKFTESESAIRNYRHYMA